VTSTSAGYQSVGRNPATRREGTSTTATAFSPESVTNRVRPSGVTARPSGFAPFGWSWTSETSIVARSASVFVPMTETVSEFALAV
jgi:hypothetical protein